VRRREEYEHSVWSFREANPVVLRRQFEEWEAEALRLLARTEGEEPAALVVPAHESLLKCSHLFNVLDARGALSVTERSAMIQRIRKLACRAAAAYVAQREAMGFPLLRAVEAR